MRGEYRLIAHAASCHWELPPRARRIRRPRPEALPLPGTTSACAENTRACLDRVRLWGNYLRVRGEYEAAPVAEEAEVELPPRARRIPPHPHIHATSLGTTSACAENTRKPHRLEFPAWNYLRVRGEYNWPVSSVGVSVELPPRARRIQCLAWTTGTNFGTTSACAENTQALWLPGRRCRNYLRVRGEYGSLFVPSPGKMELPPRARRIRGRKAKIMPTPRTTSACAENTAGAYLFCYQSWNYLRVRGEYPK